tara:strand:+ start:56 stop:229 length:174 start_codon:yes stop_codon:yes gene_type:complete
MDMKTMIPLVAIVAIATIEIYALSLGINGHIMMMTMGLIALIAGVKLRDWWDNRGSN